LLGDEHWLLVDSLDSVGLGHSVAQMVDELMGVPRPHQTEVLVWLKSPNWPALVLDVTESDEGLAVLFKT
jgi:hypothetical protein